jgi:uncharacterized protein
LRILISGASGFIGGFLFSFFSGRQHEVVPLLHEMSASGAINWRSGNGSSLEDFDAVIHLAGEPLSFERWSARKREKILVSRAEGTSALSQSLAQLRRPPSVWISASAVGYYGNRGEELLDEGSAPGKGFLSHVCCVWEQGSSALNSRGARTVHARFGMVLGFSGGALKKLVSLYRMCLGGRLSTGDQWMSWIALPDLASALDHILQTDSLCGPVNIVSPHAVRQKEFSQLLAQALHRPAFLNLPAWLLRLQFGATADELLLSSARVVPKKLCASGFRFKYPNLQDCFTFRGQLSRWGETSIRSERLSNPIKKGENRPK